MRLGRALALAVIMGGGLECTCGVPGVGDDLYACKSDDECLTTHECLSGRCRPKGTAACPTVDCNDSACDGRSCGTTGQICTNKACACGGNGGTPQATESACGDTFDNDCNGQGDCADPTCDALACGSGGTCTNGLCACAAAGGSLQAVESLCSDNLDNDCDGLADCLDPSCANIGCGLSGRVCIADAGACQCGGNGGTREGSEASCGDLADNDCDGNTDCADDTCVNQPCKANGFRCSAMVCTCSGNGGTAEQASEVSCTDGFDNDCDGMSDCADPSCDQASCGSGCSCQGGAKRETACQDTMDNDGDGASDCADPDCAGTSCGAFGLACSSGSCQCVVDGGVAQATESICDDGRDNDCTGAADCNDTSCDGRTCGPNKLCLASACACSVDGGTTEPTEVSCGDGLDNDCDGLADCADPDCSKKSCSGVSSAFVCCGTTCVNTASNTSNCGGCGVACASGRACNSVTAGGFPTGRCSCNNGNQCPLSQSCGGGSCACGSASNCASGEVCASSGCHYP